MKGFLRTTRLLLTLGHWYVKYQKQVVLIFFIFLLDTLQVPLFGGGGETVGVLELLTLDGGADGLDCYRRIAHQASDHIRPGGYLLLEVGDGQSAEVEKLLAEVGRFAEVETKPDLNEVPRVVVARASST